MRVHPRVCGGAQIREIAERAHGVNLNQGAESTLSYLMARLTLEKALHRSVSLNKDYGLQTNLDPALRQGWKRDLFFSSGSLGVWPSKNGPFGTAKKKIPFDGSRQTVFYY